MVKIDVKEFYMSGKPGFLSHCDETEDFKQLVARAVDWLCRNQFVQSEFLPDLTYRVSRGSVMGLLHSGEVSDAGFWIVAERWLLNTSVRKWCSLTCWRRVRDDIFARTSARIRLFSQLSILVVNGCCVTKPRERIIAPFLSAYRAHPRLVHISWPCSVAKSFGSICLHQKNNVLLKRISWQGFRGSSRARQQFRESDGLWLNGVHE